MDTLLGGHYDAAETLCQMMYEEYGEHPAVYYARAAVLYSKFFDLEDTTGRSEFYALVDSCLFTCNRSLEQAETTEARAVLYYLRGSALSTKGLTYRQDGHTLSMVRLLMESHSSFAKAIKLNPRFYDAYLGRGAYRYGVAREASLLSWLPFMPSRQSGLADLWTAVEKSVFSKYPALSALVWFALEENNFGLADSICTVGLERFPAARSFLWPRLSLQKKQGNYEAAILTAQTLLDQYLAIENGNGYDATGLYATLSECADSLRNPELAIEYARRGISVKRSPYAEQRRAKTLEVLRKRIAQSN
ncbi:hypothetical protein KKG66_04235 [bacterium]|nr:hypothetical protein [bacterium]